MALEKGASMGLRLRDRAAAPATSFEHLGIRRLTPTIGAEIEGVDLTRPIGPALFAEIRQALADHLVIFFRDQAITPDQHVAFGRLFGELHFHPAAPHEPGRPELMIVEADANSERANGEGWHSDVSCDAEPPMGSILHLKECPPDGGDTIFANMYIAYETLS